MARFSTSSAETRNAAWSGNSAADGGGFAFQFKTLCPNVTYVISGIPETLLVASVYLMTTFPDARFRFYGERKEGDVWSDWQQI
jgi:hypothetical protein